MARLFQRNPGNRQDQLDPQVVKLLLDFQRRYGSSTLRKAITTFVADATRRLDPVMQEYAKRNGVAPEKARAALNAFFEVEAHHGGG